MNKFLKYFVFVVILCCASQKASAQLDKRYYYYVGQGLIIDGRYHEAVDMLSILLRVDATAYDGFFLRGIAKYNLGDYVGAEKDFTSAINVNSVYSMAYQYRAIARSFTGNYDEAIRDFDTAIDIRPDNEGIYYSRGITYFMSQQFDKAIADFDYFIKKKPHVVDAFINRGTCYLMKNDTLSAFNDYNQAISINKYDANGFVRRGGIYLAEQKYDSAYKDFSTSIKLDSSLVAAYFNRAIVSANKNRPLDAIKDFSKVIQLDSMSSLTYFNRAMTYSQIGDYDRALKDYAKVEEYSPSNVLLYFNRGGLNMQLGNLRDADTDFSKAISLYPDFANAYLNRSSVRYMMGDMNGSKSDKQTADLKIEEYRSKLKDSTFSNYADTSQMFSRLVSFDADFGNKEFENVKQNDIGLKILPMFRVAISVARSEKDASRYDTESIREFLKDNKLAGDALVSEPLITSIKDIENLELYYGESIDGKSSWKDYFAHGVTQNMLKQYTKATSNYSKAISKNQHNGFIYANRSVARAEMIEFISKLDGQSDKMVIDVDPVNRLKSTQRVYSYNEAIEDARKAIELSPNVAQFRYNLGNVLCLNGDYVAAIEAYTQAIDMNPFIGEAYFNRGIVQIHLKDTKTGCLDISKAGELGITSAYEILNRFK